MPAFLSRLASIRRSHPRLLLVAVLALGLASWLVAGVVAGTLYGALTRLPDADAVRTVQAMPRATTIVDVQGRHAFSLFEERRMPVPLARISPHLIGAIVAIEDQRFYDHGGIDPIRIAGAAVNNLRAGRLEQGGSTITQQLARLAFLSADKTWRRKVQEIVLATRLERHYSKEEILELYLNKAYFGDGLYGAEAAALGYFGKPAQALTLPEAALIAGLVKAPSSYAPTTSPDRALDRRNLVLRVMRDSGVIDEAAFAAARDSRLALQDGLRRREAYGQYVKEAIRQELVERFGWDRVYQEGLRVEATIDIDLQKAAEAEVTRAVEEIERRQRRPVGEPLQAALVALDPRTGEVRALVGGRAFDDSRFDRARQAKRQPGSAFKPFVYAAAIERGYSPATVLTGLHEPVATASGAWIPADEHVETDAITLRAALRVSSNRAAVRVLDAVGVDAAVAAAARFGLGRQPAVPSIVLGSGEVTVLSMVSAFGAFANHGTRVEPTLIRRVRAADGAVLYEAAPEWHEVVSPATAYLVTSMLEDVVDHGTAAQVRALGFRAPAAGKTGTTNDYRDAWFVGYTPALAAGVWVGYDQPRTIVPNGYAAQLAVPLWTRFMLAATRDMPALPFGVPGSVTTATICPISGKLATEACRRDPQVIVGVEHFAQGSEPIEWCPYHSHHQEEAWRLAASGTPGVVHARGVPSGGAPVEPAAGVSEMAGDAAAGEEPAPPKRRGFWGRLLRLGR